MKQNVLLFIALFFLFADSGAQNISGKIIFSLPGTNSSTDSICTLNPDGSGFTFITHGSRPRLSPGGGYLAFLYGTNANRSLNHIYFKEPTGSPYQWFDNSSEFNTLNFDFSPSADKVIFDWQGGFYSQLAGDPNGQTLNNGNGAGDNYDEYPRICKTDSTIVSHNINFGLYTMPFPSPTNGLIPNTVPGDLSPCWSPDGNWIYYAKQYPNQPYKLHNIYRIHRDGTNMQQITNLPLSDTLGMSLVITQNGQWIVGPARINGITGLYKFKANPAGFDTTGYLVKAFNYLSSPTANFWLGSVDSVDNTIPATSVAERPTRKVSIYPNPVTAKQITLELDAAANEVKLLNVSGQTVATFGSLHQGANTLKLPSLAAGTYYLAIRGNGFSLNKELIMPGN